MFDKVIIKYKKTISFMYHGVYGYTKIQAYCQQPLRSYQEGVEMN